VTGNNSLSLLTLSDALQAGRWVGWAFRGCWSSAVGLYWGCW